MNNKIIIVRWPSDPVRPTEVYGPFATDQERVDWLSKTAHVPVWFQHFSGAILTMGTLKSPE